jgi:hypothetical protein
MGSVKPVYLNKEDDDIRRIIENVPNFSAFVKGLIREKHAAPKKIITLEEIETLIDKKLAEYQVVERETKNENTEHPELEGFF